jgi:nicotinamidase-related amidase
VARGLVIVDIQKDYFPGGAHPLEDPEAAAASAARLLEAASAETRCSTYAMSGTRTRRRSCARGRTASRSTGRLATGRRARHREGAPEQLSRDASGDELRGAGVDELVICGMMTSMCVDATVRAAVDLGFETTVVHDACTTW